MNSVESQLSPLQVPPQELAAHTRAVMKKGSKSFSLAALLFDKKSREAAQYLYAWCRTCDDEIDNETDPLKALDRLQTLRLKTTRAFRDQPVQDPAFEAFRELCRTYEIEEVHPQQLLEGMRMDVEGAIIRNDDDLTLYCYRVAGVVGLMMARVMGVKDQRALKHAVETGLAMQMSNIARDVKEDFERSRTYIPESWFVTLGQPTPDFSKPFDPKMYLPHIQKLIAEAETLYASGIDGLKYLPFRAALAVASAQTIYREIGRRVLARGPAAWESRTVVSKPRKLYLMSLAILKVIKGRLFGFR
jgi:15-cis-phytoene synthase